MWTSVATAAIRSYLFAPSSHGEPTDLQTHSTSIFHKLTILAVYLPLEHVKCDQPDESAETVGPLGLANLVLNPPTYRPADPPSLAPFIVDFKVVPYSLPIRSPPCPAVLTSYYLGSPT